MATEIFKNTFKGGIDKDTDVFNRNPNTYFDAFNVTLTPDVLANEIDSENSLLRNFRGTVPLDTIFSGSDITSAGGPNGTRILGLQRNIYKISGVKKEGITIFAALRGGLFKVLFYNILDDTIVTVYSENYSSVHDDLSPMVDSTTYSENGVDIIYFTDFFNEPRRIVCDDSAGFPLSKVEIQLIRRGGESTITLTDVLTGGELPAGSYQFAVRLVNNIFNRYTKFTQLTNPIFVSGDDNAYVGKTTGYKITLALDFNSITDYTHYQIVVVASLDGSILPSTIGVLVDPVTLSGTTMTHTHKSNTAVGVQLDINELTIDDAAIKTFKTIEVKHNRLIVGNIEYHELDYNHGSGDPAVGSATTYKKRADVTESVDFYKNDQLASLYVGYFRDEVYRFGITYFDEFGNFSRPKVLDLSSTTNNAAASGIDFKFPTRDDVAVLNTSDDVQVLGLDIKALVNHPTWAKGFTIVRAKRKKNILFQSPYVPGIVVEPPGAVGDYPIQDRIDTEVAVALPEGAAVANQSGTIIPKNFFHTISKSIIRAKVANTDLIRGEVRYEVDTGETSGTQIDYGAGTGYLFAPEIMYDVTGGRFGSYNRTLGNQMRTVDIAFLTNTVSDKTVGLGANVAGDYGNMDIEGFFYAKSADSYYYKDGVDPTDVTTVAPPTADRTIAEVIPLENLDVGSVLQAPSSGSTTTLVNDFASLQGTFTNDGIAPDNMRMYAVRLDSQRLVADKNDIAKYCAAATTGFQDSTEVATAASHFSGILSAFYVQHQNDFVHTISGWVSASSFVSAVEIVNIEVGLDDDRYGNAEDIFEFISTGATHKFSSAELTTTGGSGVEGGSAVPIDIEVWGGDCRVVPMSCKIGNSTYSITDVDKIATGTADAETVTTNKWDHWFETGATAGDDVMRTYPLEAVSQVLSVVLETEINVPMADPEGAMVIVSGFFAFQDNPDSSGAYRSPMTYSYHGGFSKQNDQKVFFPFSSFENNTTKFPARIAYSDVKVYQTDTEGFDRFRVLNIFDMDETYGGITKLALASDRMYSLQDDGVSYVPTSSNVIEQADASILEVRSNEIIDIPIYLDTLHGCQDLQTVQVSGDTIFYADRKNSEIFKLNSNKITNIGESGMRSWWKQTTRLTTDVDPVSIGRRDFMSAYDLERDEYWIGRRFRFLWVYNNKMGAWTSEFPQDSSTITMGGLNVLSRMLVCGFKDDVGEALSLHELYNEDTSRGTGAYGFWYKLPVFDSNIEFVVNPFPDIFKVYDNIVINSTDRLKDATLTTLRENSFDSTTPTQSALMSIDVDSLEDTYRVKVIRATGGERMRGKYGKIVLNWDNVNKNRRTGIISAQTKYRPSHKPV